MTGLPIDYGERVYAGVLGKVIGVYLGRPFENWSHERIAAELGEIDSYVHEQLGMPLIVTDDDISGTFTFIRAFEDYGCSRDITAAQIGRSWLNYLIEEETILWWGGLGNSTEHTAYLRLKAGVDAPDSGSIALNGRVVAEQIGSQIFIDGWGLIAPGDPALASEFARRAASVSHDGEAIFGAQVIAAMVAQAFVTSDVDALIDAGLSVIPRTSLIHAMVEQIRHWHKAEPDWRVARDLLDAEFGYQVYGGNCHIVPNHGLIMLALLYGAGSFQKSMMIVNTAGWDTDCNSGNLGCLLGVMNGLEGIDGTSATSTTDEEGNREAPDAHKAATATDWRGPVADRMYLPTAEGGRAITDALTESVHVANMGRRLAGLQPEAPKGGSRFHFELPGAVQGFTAAPESDGLVAVRNVVGFSERGTRSLAIVVVEDVTRPILDGIRIRVETPTFIPSRDVATYFDHPGYRLMASPTLHPGQVVSARIFTDNLNHGPVSISLYVKHYDATDDLTIVRSDEQWVAPGSVAEFQWMVPATDSQPIALIGVEVEAAGGSATCYLDELGWSGTPVATFGRPQSRSVNLRNNEPGPLMWRKAWVDGLDARQRLSSRDSWPEPYRLIQNQGRGLIMQGSREWNDYEVAVEMTPHQCRSGGVAVRVQGLERYYAFVCDATRSRLVRRFEGVDFALAESDFIWEMGQPYRLCVSVVGNELTARVDGGIVMSASDPLNMFTGGGVGLLVDEGRVGCDRVEIHPPR